MTDNNNLTLVYKGPDYVYVDIADLCVKYWNWWSWDESWELDMDFVCWWDIKENITGIWNKSKYAYPVYVRIPLYVHVLDNLHGRKMQYTAHYFVYTFLPWIKVNKTRGVGITEISLYSKTSFAYLDPKRYYIWFDVGPLGPSGEKVIENITLTVQVSKLNIARIDIEGSLELSFNEVASKLVLLHLSPENYYNISLTITEGGNWSVTAYLEPLLLPVPQRFQDYFITEFYPEHFYGYLKCKIWGNSTRIHREQIMVQNLIPLKDWLYYHWHYALEQHDIYYKKTLPIIRYDVMGVDGDLPVYVMLGELVKYTDGYVKLMNKSFSYVATSSYILLRIIADPLYQDPITGKSISPSSEVRINISAKIIGSMETLESNIQTIVELNSSIGPAFKVFKARINGGKLYLLNVTPLKYGINGWVNTRACPLSFEDWWSYWKYIDLKLSKTFTNESSLLVLSPIVQNATYYIYVSVREGDASKVCIELKSFDAKNYTVGEMLALSIEPFDLLIKEDPNRLRDFMYEFEINENCTYIVTVEVREEFTSGYILIIDEKGNLPFKYVDIMWINNPYYNMSADYKEYSWEFTAKSDSRVFLYVWGDGGTISITITKIYSYEAGYQEGYEVGYNEGYQAGNITGFELGNRTGYELGFAEGNATGFELGNETGYELGFEEGNETGYEAGFEAGNESGYSAGFESGAFTGRITGFALGASVGAVIGVAVMYVISRRIFPKGT